MASGWWRTSRRLGRACARSTATSRSRWGRWARSSTTCSRPRPRTVRRLTLRTTHHDQEAPMTTQAERVGTTQPRTSQEHIELVERTTAHNYHPLPVVVAAAEGCWVTDVEGRRYLDMLSAYSALNFGHRHPELIAAAKDQLDRVTLTSRAFHNDQMGPFLRDLTELCGMDMALLMNSGAEAVETAIKTVRKWGYEVKGVAPDRAKVIVAGENFHGRTITIVSFSTDEPSRRNFGPLTPGFEVVPYGDATALEAAIDEDTVAFLVEPTQGEAGGGARSRGGARGGTGGVPRGADPGRGRGRRPAGGLPPPRARALYRAEGA